MIRPMDKITQYFEIDKPLTSLITCETYKGVKLCEDKNKMCDDIKIFIEKEIRKALGDAILIQKSYVYPLPTGVCIELFIKPAGTATILEYHLKHEDGVTTLNRIIRRDD